MSRRKLLIVSNRLPVIVTKDHGKLKFTPSPGGLPTAILDLVGNKDDCPWIGWPGINSEDLSAGEKKQITEKLKEFNCLPVFLSKSQSEGYYDGYSNSTIWPLFHYFQSLVSHQPDYWNSYKEVNEIFKKAVLNQADAETSIWIHDYHLMLLPGLIRLSLPGSTIGFFLHTPFPSYEIFRLLPQRSEILQGLLGADLIGFQVYDYARHFLSSALRILGQENQQGTIVIGDRTVRVDAFPIGIDYDRFAKSSLEKTTSQRIESMQKKYQAKKIILSVDRLDYSKGIPHRLDAFEKFLENYPKWRKKIVLVVVAVPSRTKVTAYKELKSEVEKKIAQINKKYSTSNWKPIEYRFENLPFEEVAALFWLSDVALLTPLRDGMNLVAKEYVATKQGRAGVLILSEMAGAVDELPEAIRINPNDSQIVAASINEALKMPLTTQIKKISSMQRRLSKYTVKRWGEDFLQQLEETKNWQKHRGTKLIKKADEAKMLRNYARAKSRLILLDYDGTMKNLVANYDSKRAAPSKTLITLINDLASNPKNHVCIVSGRHKNIMENWFGDLDVSLAAEHGAWIRSEGEWSRQEISLNGYKQDIVKILMRYADRTPGARIEQKDFAVVWHYRNVLVELAHARNASVHFELNQLLRNSDFAIHDGDKIIEIKHKNISKGMVAEDMIVMYKPDFILCIGDDYTDEDMFQVLPDKSYSIKVGLHETSARYQLVGVPEVLNLLKKLL